MTSKRTSIPISDTGQEDVEALHAQFEASIKRNNLPKRRVCSTFEVRYDAATGERITSSRKRPRKRKPVENRQGRPEKLRGPGQRVKMGPFTQAVS